MKMRKKQANNSKLNIIKNSLTYTIIIPSISYLTKIKYKGNLIELNKLPKKVGVYFLFDEFNKLLYIGKSLNIRFRVKTHLSEYNTGRYNPEEDSNLRTSAIPFGVVTQIRYLISDKINYGWLENFYIVTYNPYFNGKSAINLNLKEKWEQYDLFRDNKIIERIDKEVEEIKKNKS